MIPLYYGTALESMLLKNILYGNFLSPFEKHIVLVRANRLDVCEYKNHSIRTIRSVNAKAKIVGSTKVKISQEDTTDCVAIFTSKSQCIIYSFTEKGDAEIRVSGPIEKGIGNETSSGVLMIALKQNALIIHSRSSSIEYVTWTTEGKKRTFLVKQFRRCAFIGAIAALDNFENHFALVEKEGHTFQCQIVKEDLTTEDIGPVEGYEPKDVGIDFTLLIPFEKTPGSVFALSCSKITFMTPQGSSVFPVIGRQHRFVTWTSLVAQTRFLLADENGDIFIMAVIMENDKVVNVELEKIGNGPVPCCVQRLDKGHFLFASTIGNHELIHIGRREDGKYFTESVQLLQNLGPALDVISIEKRSDRKLVLSSGALKHGSLRVIKNCMSIYTMAKIKFANVPFVYPLNFLSSSKSWFAIQRKRGYEILEVDEPTLKVTRYSKREQFLDEFPKFESLADILFAGVIEPHYYVYVTPAGGTITTITGEVVATLPPCSSVDVTRYGEIVISKENQVQWLRFDPNTRELTKIAEQVFHQPVWNVKYADSEDPTCRMCFVVPFLSNRIYLVGVPEVNGTLTFYIKIPVAYGRIVVDAMIVQFPEWRSYIVLSMDDGSVDYYVFDKSNRTLGTCETLNVGVQPTILCKIYVQKQLHLILCSDQATVMKADKNLLGFCNMDVKNIGFMLPLFAKKDYETVNSLLYYSDGYICLGKIIDKQKMTINEIDINETVDMLHYNDDSNILIAATRHSNLITIIPNEVEQIEQPKTMITTFETRKHLAWSASDEFRYETGAGTSPIQFIEDISSIAVFGADRFTLLDAIELSRFEDICCIEFYKYHSYTWVFVGTQLIYPGADMCDQGRILVFRIENTPGRLDQTGVLRPMIEKPVRGGVHNIKVFDHANIRVLVNGTSFGLIFHPGQCYLELQNIGNTGSLTYAMTTVYNPSGTTLITGDACQTFSITRFDKEDGKPLSQTNGHKTIFAAEFLNDHSFIVSDIEECIDLFCDLQTNPEAVEEVDASIESPKNLALRGQMYIGDVINMIRRGTPFLPIYAKPDKCSFDHRYWCTAFGSVGILARLDPDVFTFLKKIETALNIKKPSVCDHLTYRECGGLNAIPYATGPFVDGDFLKELLAYSDPNEICEGITVPTSLQENNPGLSPGYVAFRYLKELWKLH